MLTRYRNVILLALSQACYLATSMTMVTYAGLVGQAVASVPGLATLPLSLTIASTALTTAPMSMIMQRRSRRFGFRLGATFGTLGGIAGAIAIQSGSFTLLCVAAMLFGPFQASAQYYRFAATESLPPALAPRAISFVLLGGLAAPLALPLLKDWLAGGFDGYPYMGAFVFVALIACFVWLPVSLLKPIDKSFESEADTAEADEEARPIGIIARQPAYIVAVANGALGYAMMSFVMTATPLAMNICGLGDSSIDVIQKHVLAMFLPSLFTGFLIQRLGLLPILFAGQAAFALAFVTALSGLELMNFSVSLIALGVGWNFCFVGGTTLLTRTHTVAERGRAQGLNEFLVFSTTALASFAAGLILSLYGWETVNQAAFVLLVVASAITIVWSVSGGHRIAADTQTP